jgi:hypothetical protein
VSVPVELQAVLIERGFGPAKPPRQLVETVALLAASGARFLAAIWSSDGKIALSVVADDLDTVLTPGAALAAQLRSTSALTAWLSQAAQAEVSLLATIE